MPLYLYLDHPSFIHRRHPLLKVLALLLFFIAAFVVDHPLFILPVSLGILLLVVFSGSGANLYRFRHLFFFIFLFTLLIWSIFYREGERLLPFAALPVTHDGLLFGLGMAMKLSTFLAISALFLSTTRIEEFTYAFSLLGMPYRMSFAITLAFRLVPLFLEAVLTLIQAQRCRGLDIHRGPLWRRMRYYALVLIPVFMGVLRRADHMAIALEVRGFNSGSRRTSYPRPPWRPSDTWALIGVTIVALFYLGLWWAGYGRVEGRGT